MTSSTTNYAPGAQLPYQLSRTVYVCVALSHICLLPCVTKASNTQQRAPISPAHIAAAGSGQVRPLSPQALSVPWAAAGAAAANVELTLTAL